MSDGFMEGLPLLACTNNRGVSVSDNDRDDRKEFKQVIGTRAKDAWKKCKCPL